MGHSRTVYTAQDKTGHIEILTSTLKKMFNHFGWTNNQYGYVVRQWNNDTLLYKGYKITRHQL